VAHQPASSPSERRKYPRINAGIPLELRRSGNDVPIRARTSDIGAAGCYVEMSITLEVGSEADVVLWLGEERLTTRARVATCHPQFGNGFEFVGISPEDQDRLAAFVNSIAT
jgi:hypothetical protein